MRPIKFRAWDIDNKKMIPEEGGFYLGSADSEMVGIEGYSIMQYTGLKDKNGKEIYEGDTVTMKLENTVVEGEIVYRPPSFYLGTNCDSWDLDGYRSIKIIGNI